MNDRTINNTNYGFDKNNMCLSIRDINILIPCYHISMTNRTSKLSVFWIYLSNTVLYPTKVEQVTIMEYVHYYEKRIVYF